MSAAPGCVECGAALAPDQEYCLDCGASQAPPPGPRWRRALVAAGLTIVIAGLALGVGYRQLSDDADSAASHGASVKPAPASGRGGDRDAPRRAAAARFAASPSR
jgi:hypothetical protein